MHARRHSACVADKVCRGEQEIHMAYLEAGADILETNSFSGTVIAQVL